MVDAWPNFAVVQDPAEWLPIRYWSYWDFALDFATMADGRVIIFRCPFLETEDAYATYFDLHEVIGVEQVPERFPDDWGKRTRPLGRLPITAVTLDPTRKAFIRKDCLREVLTTPGKPS